LEISSRQRENIKAPENDASSISNMNIIFIFQREKPKVSGMPQPDPFQGEYYRKKNKGLSLQMPFF
jgi:hypothetical protein